MTTTTETRTGPVVLTAPIGGSVKLFPPRMLCGELEIFQAHETIATIADGERIERVEAPANGFLWRTMVSDGDLVRSGTPLLVFNLTG